jgi:hypothetical protein
MYVVVSACVKQTVNDVEAKCVLFKEMDDDGAHRTHGNSNNDQAIVKKARQNPDQRPINSAGKRFIEARWRTHKRKLVFQEDMKIWQKLRCRVGAIQEIARDVVWRWPRLLAAELLTGPGEPRPRCSRNREAPAMSARIGIWFLDHLEPQSFDHDEMDRTRQ